MAESKKKRSSANTKPAKQRRAPKKVVTEPTTSAHSDNFKPKDIVITHRTSSEPTKNTLTKPNIDFRSYIPSNLSSTLGSLARNRGVWAWTAITLVSLLLVLVAWWQWQRSYVGVVNGQYIYSTSLEEQLVANSGAQTLDTLIQQQLILQDAHKNGIQISTEAIQAELDTFKESTGGDEAFQSSLIEYGISEDLLRNQIMVRLALEELLADDIAVSEDEIKEYYEQNKDEVDVAKEGYEAARERIEMQLSEQRLSQASSQYIEGLQETSSISRNIDHSTLTFGRFIQEDVLSIPGDVWNLFASLAPAE